MVSAKASDRVQIAAVILAAGRGRRVGAPKAFLPVKGRPWIAHQLRWVRQCGTQEIHVVGSAEDASIWDSVSSHLGSIRLIWNHHLNYGSFHSLQLGLRACGTTHAIVLPVDVPCPSSCAWIAIQNGLGRGLETVVPMYFDRPGHPIGIASSCFDELLSMDPKLSRLDYWLRARSERRRAFVEVVDKRITMNLNSIADWNSDFPGDENCS